MSKKKLWLTYAWKDNEDKKQMGTLVQSEIKGSINLGMA